MNNLHSAPLLKVREVISPGEQHRLIIEHMELVARIASNFRDDRGIPFEDLLSAGRVGLVKAARKWPGVLRQKNRPGPEPGAKDRERRGLLKPESNPWPRTPASAYPTEGA